MIRVDRLIVVMVASVATLAATGVTLSEGPASAPAASTPVKKTPAPAFAAMKYYDQSCSNCHGPQGSFYGPTLGNDLTDDGLVKECYDMAAGPANAPISEQENAVETAFHRALIMRTPYLSVTEIKDGKWAGEVMPDSKVTLTVGDKKIDAKVTGWNWTAEVGAGTKAKEVTVEAELKGKTTVLKPAEAMHSHNTPLPPQGERQK